MKEKKDDGLREKMPKPLSVVIRRPSRSMDLFSLQYWLEGRKRLDGGFDELSFEARQMDGRL